MQSKKRRRNYWIVYLLNMRDKETEKCGFIALMGASNSGKSTLLNRLVGSKVSIVSPKVQTTRTRILGICLQKKAQLIFVDTPGVFFPKRRLDRAMVAAAWSGAADADRVLVLVDCSQVIDNNTENILERLLKEGIRSDLVLNKIDLVKKSDLLEMSRLLNQPRVFDNTFMISAKNGDGVDTMLSHLCEKLPFGPWLYPEDQISDLPERLLAEEITREKIFYNLHKEIPYASAVETELWEMLGDGSLRIQQIVYVRRDSQKKVILGKNGNRIKTIGSEARRELCELFGCNVHLMLFVKVRENWAEDPQRYRQWGLNFDV